LSQISLFDQKKAFIITLICFHLMFMIPHQTLAGGLVGSYELTQFTNLRLLGHRPTSDNKQIMWFGNRGSWHGNGVCIDPMLIHATSHLRGNIV